MNQEAKIEKLLKKHDLEKQAAVLEFNNFREKATLKEQKMLGEFQQKFEGLKKEIESMNKKFQDKLHQLESINQSLQKDLETSKSSGSAGLVNILSFPYERVTCERLSA